MKNIKIFITIIGLALVTACNDSNILDLTPINNISVSQSFATPALIQSSVVGMYNAAAIGAYNSGTANGGRGYVWGSAYIQQGDNRGEDVVNTATFYQLTYTATYDPTSANNVYYWIDGYRLINRCNLVIEGVTTAVANNIITQAVADDYIGQAKFLRAITHFELNVHFARPYQDTPAASHLGVPYREVGVDTQAEIDSEVAKPRNTVAEVYAKVLADLDDAERKITANTLTYASKNAAIAFKTRVYLHMRNWAKVIEEGVKLNGKYTLTAHPGTPFLNSYSNTESIFSMLQAATLNPGVNAALASQYNRRTLVCISPIIWRDTTWKEDDKRRFESATDPLAMVFTNSGRKYTNKYKDGVNYTDASPIIRYAEVLLNMAEAYARQGNIAAGLTNLNLVRNRSLATPATQGYTSFATKEALTKAVLKERRIEFMMEGRRWADIHRLQKDDIDPIVGIPQKVANGNPAAALFTLGTPFTGPYGVNALPYDDFRFVWPLPQEEINANKNLEQNPGWK